MPAETSSTFAGPAPCDSRCDVVTLTNSGRFADAEQRRGVALENSVRVFAREGLTNIVDEVLEFLRRQHGPIGAQQNPIDAERLTRAAERRVLLVDRVEPEAPRQVARHDRNAML